MDAAWALHAAAACVLAWSSALLLLRPRPPAAASRTLAAGLAAASGLAAAGLALPVPSLPLAGLALALTGVALAATRAWWPRRAAAVLLPLGAAVATTAVLAGPAWARIGLIAAGATAVALSRRDHSFPALARGGVAGALGALGGAASASALGDAAGPAALLASAVLLVAFEVVSPRIRGWPSAGALREPLHAGVLVLDRYRPERRLGGGASGETWFARDEVAGVRVALKWLRHSGPGDKALEREARALAGVRHPNVVQLVDAGVDPVHGGVVVLEAVEGGSLADRLRAGPLPRAEFEAVALGLLGGLAAVHRAGFLHRDVKPANVLLAPGDGAKLGDFGLAGATGLDTTRAEGAGPGVGTPRYMSPELARGGSASRRSDVWAAGATLYEALTGRPFVEAEEGATVNDVLSRVAALGPFDREIPDAALRRFFERALAPDRADRFEDAVAMEKAFRDRVRVPP